MGRPTPDAGFGESTPAQTRAPVRGIRNPASAVAVARYCPGAGVDLARGTPNPGANSSSVLDVMLADDVAPAGEAPAR